MFRVQIVIAKQVCVVAQGRKVVSGLFPMLEMAEERAYFIEDIIHVYNRDNPLNEDKVNHELQLSIEATVRGKKVYDRLED